MAIHTITVSSLKQLLKQQADIQLIDVREVEEYDEQRINEARNVPLSELSDRVNEFNTADDYVIICRSGNRSHTACQLLNDHGVKVTNVAGGMIEWNRP